MKTLALDAMGVIYAAGDDVAELLCPFIREHGGLSDDSRVPDWFFRSDALFMRHAGFTLLLIPAGWALSTALLARLEANIWSQWSMIAAGIAAVLFGMWYFMLLAFNPCIL
jgi:hypothetical protein